MIDTKAMIPVDQIDDTDLRSLAEDARRFLSEFKWCHRITATHLAWGCPGVLAVFLCQLEPSQSEVDDTLWVVTGDLPPAYLVCDDNPTWELALGGYVKEMRRWIDAVRKGEELDEIIPVNVAPTTEHADMLESRLNFGAEKITGDNPTTASTSISDSARGIRKL